MWFLIKKILGAYTKIRHRKVPISLRYYCRDTYYCAAMQLKYALKDYLLKKKYKTITFEGEFAPELQFVLPYAYWHYKNGTLKATRSSKYTSEFYFFSTDHQEIFEKRSPAKNYNYEIPRILYSHNYDMAKWAAVPLKEHYKNNIYQYDKPIVIVANRYNMEWDGPPISFFDIPLLDSLFEKLKRDFTIIYNRPDGANITEDNSQIYDLNEFGWMRENHPEVITMKELYEKNEGQARNFNHLQLMVYANADRFISVHGGTAALASYFGGINIILSKKGPEHYFQCYQKLYPKLSGSEIHHAKSDKEMEEKVIDYILENK